MTAVHIVDKIRHTTSKKGWCYVVEKAKRRIRVCLLIVVLAAVCIGIVYYCYTIKGGDSITEGTLIANVRTGWERLVHYGFK